jgi:putative intracellular protease/amidase
MREPHGGHVQYRLGVGWREDDAEIAAGSAATLKNPRARSHPVSLRDPNLVNPARRKRVAIVLSNPATSTTTGWPVGFWWSELTHPWLAFTEAGYEVELFSPQGGRCVPDAMSDPRDASGYSSSDLVSMGFIATPALAALVEDTRPVTAIEVARFDAIVVAGGQAPMFTFEQATALSRKFVEFFESGRIAAALCHGTAVLRYATLSDGTPLVKGRTVTGFANVEEDFADQAVWSMNLLPRDRHVMPWRIEDELRKLGANFVQAGLWRGFAVRDGNLITGQQNFSGAETAAAVIEALGR